MVSRLPAQQQDRVSVTAKMQYYTRQQLQGSLRYANSVLVGNWNEDRCVKETVLKDFLHKADTGTLKIDQCAPSGLATLFCT